MENLSNNKGRQESVSSIQTKKITWPMHKRRIATALAILLLIVLAMIFYFNTRNESAFSHKYTPGAVIKATARNGSGIVFSKPSEFINTTNDTSKTSDHLFKQSVNVGGKQVTSGYLYTATAIVTPQIFNYLNYFNPGLKLSPTTDGYKASILPVKNTVDFVLKDYPNRVVNNPKPFTSPTIKSNAWIFDVSATGAKNGLPDQQGKAIYAWTNKTAYFYILTVAKENWQPNLAVWRDMINSLKLE